MQFSSSCLDLTLIAGDLFERTSQSAAGNYLAYACGVGRQCGRGHIALHCEPCGEQPIKFPWVSSFLYILSLTTTNHPHTTNRMTSPVPLRPYNQRRLSEDYTDSTFVPSTSKSGTPLHDEAEYDPYTDTSHLEASTAFEDSAKDGMHKPSLSYGSKELGKWPQAIPRYHLSETF